MCAPDFQLHLFGKLLEDGELQERFGLVGGRLGPVGWFMTVVEFAVGRLVVGWFAERKLAAGAFEGPALVATSCTGRAESESAASIVSSSPSPLVLWLACSTKAFEELTDKLQKSR